MIKNAYSILKDRLKFVEDGVSLKLDDCLKEVMVGIHGEHPDTENVTPMRLLTTISILLEDGSIIPLVIKKKGGEDSVDLGYEMVIEPTESSAALALGNGVFSFRTEDTLKDIIDRGTWVNDILTEFDIDPDSEDYTLDHWAYYEAGVVTMARSFVIKDVKLIKPYVELRTDIFKPNQLAGKSFENISMENVPHEELFTFLKTLEVIGV